MNPHDITKAFEEKVADYTGAPYCVALDNMSNALFLCMTYEDIRGRTIGIPKHTYPSVPCEIIHAGGIVEFYDSPKLLKGSYLLLGSRTIDSALRFTADMYEFSSHFYCVSFTGQYKHLKLGKGGAILTDSKEAYEWFKRTRYSGRREISYHEDNLDMLGWNYYMNPMIAALGLHLMGQFYNLDGTKKQNEDLELPYPDLSQFEVYNER